MLNKYLQSEWINLHIHTPITNEKNDIAGSEILGFCGFPWFFLSCLLLKVRMMGRYQSQLFCWQGQRYIINLKPAWSWALLFKCSLSRLRNDYFHVLLASPVWHVNAISISSKIMFSSSAHTPGEKSCHCLILSCGVPATGTLQSSHSPLIQTELFWIVSHMDSRSFPIMLCGSQDDTDHTRDVFSTGVATAFSS